MTNMAMRKMILWYEAPDDWTDNDVMLGLEELCEQDRYNNPDDPHIFIVGADTYVSK